MQLGKICGLLVLWALLGIGLVKKFFKLVIVIAVTVFVWVLFGDTIMSFIQSII